MSAETCISVDVETFARCRGCRGRVYAERCTADDDAHVVRVAGEPGFYVPMTIDGRGCSRCGCKQALMRVRIGF